MKTPLRALFVLLLSGFLSSSGLLSSANTNTNEHHDARALYDTGDFAGALAQWQALFQRGEITGALLYNIGNALVRLDRIGEALLFYRRAELLMPGDPDLSANIRHVAEQAGVDWPQPSPLVSMLRLPGPDGWFRFTIAAFWIGAILCGVRLLGRLSRLPWPNFLITWLLLISLGIAGSFISMAPFHSEEVVGIKGRKEARFGPIDSDTLHFTLPEGQPSRVLERRAQWVRIQSGNDRGWVRDDHLIVVYPWTSTPLEAP